MIIKHKKFERMKRLRPLFLLSHFAKIFISLTPFCCNCFLLSSPSKQVVTFQHGTVFIDYSLSCQWWQQNEKTTKMLSNNSPSFSLSISTGRHLKGKACQCGFHFTTPLPTREREAWHWVQILKTKEIKKWKFWFFSFQIWM